MHAHTAYRQLYSRCIRGLDESAVLHVNAILELPGAQAHYDAHRAKSVTNAEWEIA